MPSGCPVSCRQSMDLAGASRLGRHAVRGRPLGESPSRRSGTRPPALLAASFGPHSMASGGGWRCQSAGPQVRSGHELLSRDRDRDPKAQRCRAADHCPSFRNTFVWERRSGRVQCRERGHPFPAGIRSWRGTGRPCEGETPSSGEDAALARSAGDIEEAWSVPLGGLEVAGLATSNLGVQRTRRRGEFRVVEARRSVLAAGSYHPAGGARSGLAVVSSALALNDQPTSRPS